jgi:RNA polymerase sigma-70 factor (ECF subfamily)
LVEGFLEHIIKGCQRKDPKAQHALYNNYKAKMYAICLRYAECVEDAEDVFQEAFVKIFEKIYQFEFKGSFEGWMRRIMVNTALEKYRKKLNVIHLNDTIKEMDTPGEIETDEELSAKDLLNLVQELSPRYKMVFNLYAIEGYSHKEIAEMLQISEGTSKSNLSRARDILQKKVEQLQRCTKKATDNS